MSSLGIGLTPAVPKSRDDIEATAQGFLGEAFSRKQIQSNQILASQQLEAIAVGLRGGTVISNLYVSVNVNGATLTLTKGGIYDKSGNRLAASADVSSSFTAGTTQRSRCRTQSLLTTSTTLCSWRSERQHRRCRSRAR
jgi:hypothetical protein